MLNSITVTLHCNKQAVNIHLVSTGFVAVKSNFRENKHSGILALPTFLFDKHFTEWMPIFIMIVEHPEGIFIIDTGEVTDVNNKDYFKSSGIIANWFDKKQFKFLVNREDEIDEQLRIRDIPVEKIKAVILTHLHFDHTDGLKYFPDTTILVNKAEWEKPFGDLPKLYPSWFNPRLVPLTEQYNVFDKAQYLTEAKDIILVETPGHTYHHCSVIIKTDECSIFFAGDICYSQEQIIRNKFPANNTSNNVAKATYKKVKSFARKNPVVFIPSHEAMSVERLKKCATMFYSNIKDYC